MPDLASTANLSQWHRSLDGWWIAHAAMLCGVRLPPDALPGLALLLVNQTLYFGSDIGTIDVDRDLTPATIDILITRGPNRWRFIPGILQQHDKRLRLCLDLSGANRPATFRSLPGSRVLLVTYERPP
jgi:uncharacterized protein (TIGR03067 family)